MEPMILRPGREYRLIGVTEVEREESVIDSESREAYLNGNRDADIYD